MTPDLVTHRDPRNVGMTIQLGKQAADEINQLHRERVAVMAAEIEAMREVVAAAEKCRHWHDCSYNPATGKTEGVIISAVSFWELHAALTKLKPFIKP